MEEYKNPKNLMNAEVNHMLADMWANVDFREYLWNERNKYIKGLKSIKTGTIEGDALALSKGQGNIESIERLLFDMKTAYANINKESEVSNATNKKR